MPKIRSFYDRLPKATRTRIRKIIPDSTLRWYAHLKTDVYLISYPKCGRTWLRLMLGKAITLHYNLPDNEENIFLKDRRKMHPDVPTIAVIHDDRPMLKTPDELERSKHRFKNKSVIFLVRDPRDVIVSSYFEFSQRNKLFGDNPYEARSSYYEGSISNFIDQDRGGFDTILQYFNIWAANKDVPNNFLLVRYEDMKQNPANVLRKALEFLGLDDISNKEINKSVEYASFDNMRKLEEKGQVQSSLLKPGDKNNPDSYKTRKGKIGSYQDNLTQEEIKRLNDKMSLSLSSYFGYSAGYG